MNLIRTGTNPSVFNHYFVEYTEGDHFYHERFNFEADMKARLEQINALDCKEKRQVQTWQQTKDK